MLLILRIILFVIYLLVICMVGMIWCSFSPRNPYHVSIFGRMIGKLSTLFGIKVELRKSQFTEKYIGNAIYIANHQNNYDMIILSKIIPDNTVTLGKKSLFWIPFFGFFYWITGNILIDRNNKIKSYGTIMHIVKQLKKKRISFWIFPEGTRSNGRGLLPFKSGAFLAARLAEVPVIPVVFSNTHDKIKLNRFRNGLVIIEMLSPIHLKNHNLSVRELSKVCHDVMLNKLKTLNDEVEEREKNGNI
ncbi:1-acyl-sn-glycerol-3-phosphate acyltransferase [Candidatus Pantoea edessiphila]|uniref:1-acyl-sn-glycerol-3-phosphate acyltransferase n=1 Tax=Candidatus Pantoea edessiphila TaxID=2044610 RepID=A0A2P5SXU6_9GAMM|nr:1-acylglycerol-3-phosphate O-acyltransferase [Candidatus Pantoea edessiphila]MBK4775748.1 1-acylglycerol-3-phosphate O-acyltransferase [Pantoea sp. Edef]PPI87144.1 1-acyl-sn-glycerol-3-phosphate acyltransferase [Candidatus Pantoea edessiphila]